MALDDGDKAIIREIAFEAAEHTAKRVSDTFALKIELHQAECPIGRRFAAAENTVKGGWRTLATIGAIISSIAALVVSWFKG